MTLLEIPVIQSADDAVQTGSTMSLTGAEGLVDATTEWFGFRFQNVTIPQGQTILSAYLELSISASTFDEPNHTIYCEDADNAAVFTTTANDITNRSRTTATATWASADLGAGANTVVNTADFTSAVQEVVDRAGWASGNSLVVLIQGSADGARDLGVNMYDDYALGTPGSLPPVLVVEYADGDVTIQVPASAALSGTSTRTVPASAALQSLGLERTVPASAALSETLTRDVPASAAIKSVLSREVPASAATSSSGTLRTVKASASIIRPELDGGYDLDSGMGEPDGTGERRHWRGIREGDYVNAHLPYAGVGGSSPLLRLLERTYTTGDLTLECDWQYIGMQTEPRRPGPLGQPNPRVISDDLEGLARQSSRRTDSRGRLAKVR